MDMFEYFGYFADENNIDRLIAAENRVLDHLFDKYLPGSGDLLDSSAGYGRNAFRFADLGYNVTAGDFIADHADAIKHDPRSSKLKEVFCSNPKNLSAFGNETFDVVISLGSMYHMRTKAEREVFTRESLRVLKPGGTFAFSYMTPFALTYGQFCISMATHDAEKRMKAYRKLANVDNNHVCDVFYGMTLEEMTDLSREYKLHILTVASTYSMPFNMASEIDKMSDEEYDKFIDTQIATCEDPVAARYCMRGLYIGKKKSGDMFD